MKKTLALFLLMSMSALCQLHQPGKIVADNGADMPGKLAGTASVSVGSRVTGTATVSFNKGLVAVAANSEGLTPYVGMEVFQLKGLHVANYTGAWKTDSYHLFSMAVAEHDKLVFFGVRPRAGVGFITGSGMQSLVGVSRDLDKYGFLVVSGEAGFGSKHSYLSASLKLRLTRLVQAVSGS